MTNAWTVRKRVKLAVEWIAGAILVAWPIVIWLIARG